MRNIEYTKTKVWETTKNGHIPEIDLLRQRNIITYRIDEKEATQSYIETTDLVVCPLIRDNKDGMTEVGLVKKYNSGTIQDKNNGCLLECLSFATDFKEASQEKISDIVEKNISLMGQELKELTCLDIDPTPISHSFTDQEAVFVAAEVSVLSEENKDIIWIQLNQIESYLEKLRIGATIRLESSGQTIYALNKLLEVYEKRIVKKMDFNEELVMKRMSTLEIKYDGKETNKNPRYSIKEVIYSDEKKEMEGEYAKSGDSVLCMVVRQYNNKIQFAVSPQIRSPFITATKYKGLIDDTAGGMIEKGESVQEAAIREAEEEIGYKTCKVQMIHNRILLSTLTTERIYIYLGIAEEKTHQNLDKEEIAYECKWYDLDDADSIKKLHLPLIGKNALKYSREYIRKNYRSINQLFDN